MMNPSFRKPFMIVVLPLLAIIPVCIVLVILGHAAAAQAVVDFGTIFVVMGAFCYVVFFDSKKRWPDVPWFTRFNRIVTCYRK